MSINSYCMSVKRNLFIKFLNGDLLEINYHPEDDFDTIYKTILGCKPELNDYELILFHLNEENGTNRIRDFHQLSNVSMIGIYVRKKPHVEIIFDEPVNFYNINTIDFDGYSYKGEIQKYKAMLFMDDNDSRYDFIFYYDKYSNKFAYDTELHSLDVVEFNNRGRPCMEGYCKWFSVGDMITGCMILPSHLIEYAPLFDKEWNTNLLYFARV